MKQPNNDSIVLYHYTCTALLKEILDSRYLKMSTSSFSLSDFSAHPVVWLTSSPSPDNMGLIFQEDIPDFFNKTHVRISIRKRAGMERWLDWCAEKGVPEDMMQLLIATASAEETHKTWYVSEGIIPVNDFLVVENLITGEVYYQKEINQSETQTQESFLDNLEQLHTTELGFQRIRRNLDLDEADPVMWCKQQISSADNIIRKGKNWYVYCGGVVITVNAHSYTIITAHKEK